MPGLTTDDNDALVAQQQSLPAAEEVACASNLSSSEMSSSSDAGSTAIAQMMQRRSDFAAKLKRLGELVELRPTWMRGRLELMDSTWRSSYARSLQDEARLPFVHQERSTEVDAVAVCEEAGEVKFKPAARQARTSRLPVSKAAGVRPSAKSATVKLQKNTTLT